MPAFAPRAGCTGRALLLALGLLGGCGESDVPDDVAHPARAAEVARIVAATEAIAGAHVPTLDPHTMSDAEVAEALGAGPRCAFRYTSAGRPILAIRSSESSVGEAVVKLNGHLVLLQPLPGSEALVLNSGDIRMTASPVGGGQPQDLAQGRRHEMDVVFEIGTSLKVGYRGYYECIG